MITPFIIIIMIMLEWFLFKIFANLFEQRFNAKSCCLHFESVINLIKLSANFSVYLREKMLSIKFTSLLWNNKYFQNVNWWPFFSKYRPDVRLGQVTRHSKIIAIFAFSGRIDYSSISSSIIVFHNFHSQFELCSNIYIFDSRIMFFFWQRIVKYYIEAGILHIIRCIRIFNSSQND